MNSLWQFAAKLGVDEIGAKGGVLTGDGNLLSGILNAAYFWAGIICVIIIIVAGFFYVTSTGEASKVKRAKDAILGAVIGLVVIVFAFGITQLVMGSV